MWFTHMKGWDVNIQNNISRSCLDPTASASACQLVVQQFDSRRTHIWDKSATLTDQNTVWHPSHIYITSDMNDSVSPNTGVNLSNDFRCGDLKVTIKPCSQQSIVFSSDWFLGKQDIYEKSKVVILKCALYIDYHKHERWQSTLLYTVIKQTKNK